VARKQLSLGIAAIALCAGAAYAIDWTIDEWRYRALLADRVLTAGERDITVKRETGCPDPSNTQVFVTFGQSNAANHGTKRLTAPAEAYDFFDGRCFSGDDPQFSATGDTGSPWPAFAHSLRDSGEQRPILMVNVAAGNTRIDQWLPGTKHAEYLQQEIRALQAKGYNVAAFLFFQGESDRDTPEDTYLNALTNIADMTMALSPNAPLIVSDSSICDLAIERGTVSVGPDTDALGQEHRSDGCHFGASGLRKVGVLWAERVNDVLGSSR